MNKPSNTTLALIGFVLLAVIFAVLPLLWHLADKKPGPRPLVGVVTARDAETVTLELRQGKTMTLYYDETLPSPEQDLLTVGNEVMVKVDPVVDGRPEIIGVRTRPTP